MNWNKTTLTVLIVSGLALTIATSAQVFAPTTVPTTSRQGDLLIEHAMRFSIRFDAQQSDFSMARIFKNHSMILVGEPTHGMKEFREFVRDLTMYGAKRFGVRKLLLELNYATGEDLNDFVLGGHGNVEAVLRHGGGFIWNDLKTESIFTTLRDYNATVPKGARIQVGGFDLEYSSTAGKAVASMLRKSAPASMQSQASNLADYLDQEAASSATTMRSKNAIYDDHLSDAVALVRNFPPSQTRDQLHHRLVALRDGRRYAKIFATSADEAAANRFRDFSMANRTLDIRGTPDTTTIVYGHNSHIQRGRFNGAAVDSMGFHIAAELGRAALVIGSEYGRGTMRAVPRNGPRANATFTLGEPAPSSISSALLPLDHQILIDLADPDDDSEWSNWLRQPELFHDFVGAVYSTGDEKSTQSLVPVDAFDILLFIPRATALTIR